MRWNVTVLAVVLCIVAAGAAAAQSMDMEGRVTGGASERTEVLPAEMRMSVSLQVRGDTMELAVEAYRAKRENMTKLIAEAGAVTDSIKISDPQAGEGGQSNSAQMRRMMAMQRGGQADEEEEPEQPKVLSFTAAATWTLSKTTLEELLIEADALEKKISAIDFVEKKTLTPEEEELLEEMDDDDYSMYDEEQTAPPGKPSFSYARKVDRAEITRLEKAAYEKAVAAAQHTAAIAGREVGPLASISVSVDTGRPSDTYDYYERQMYARMRGGMGYTDESDDENETTAFGQSIAKLRVTAQVTVNFYLK